MKPNAMLRPTVDCHTSAIWVMVGHWWEARVTCVEKCMGPGACKGAQLLTATLQLQLTELNPVWH